MHVRRKDSLDAKLLIISFRTFLVAFILNQSSHKLYLILSSRLLSRMKSTGLQLLTFSYCANISTKSNLAAKINGVACLSSFWFREVTFTSTPWSIWNTKTVPLCHRKRRILNLPWVQIDWRLTKDFHSFRKLHRKRPSIMLGSVFLCIYLVISLLIH